MEDYSNYNFKGIVSEILAIQKQRLLVGRLKDKLRYEQDLLHNMEDKLTLMQ